MFNINKVEIFDKNFEYKCSHPIETIDIEFDYLTQEVQSLSVAGKTKAKKGDLLKITGVNEFEGVVIDADNYGDLSQINFKPLCSMLGVEVFNDIQIFDAVKFLCDSINSKLIQNEDAIQNLPITLTNKIVEAERKYTSENATIMLTDIISSLLTNYQIAVECKLDFSLKTIIVTVFEATSFTTIEAEKENIISKEIVVGGLADGFNKIEIREIEQDELGNKTVLQTKIFYLHTDNTISDLDVNRISPVYYTLGEVAKNENEDFEQSALTMAKEKLQATAFENEINITVRKDDKIINPQSLNIGDKVRIITDEQIIISILTGKTFANEQIILHFGLVRTSLTKKLILERRKK